MFLQKQIPFEISKAMVEHCQKAYPNEASGIVTQDINGHQALHINDSICPQRTTYEINPHRLIDLRRRQLTILGFYHSHPDASSAASPRDLQKMHFGQTPLWPGVFWAILSIHGALCIDLSIYLWNQERLEFDVFCEPWTALPTKS